jgi:hypothetical protein
MYMYVQFCCMYSFLSCVYNVYFITITLLTAHDFQFWSIQFLLTTAVEQYLGSSSILVACYSNAVQQKKCRVARMTFITIGLSISAVYQLYCSRQTVAIRRIIG